MAEQRITGTLEQLAFCVVFLWIYFDFGYSHCLKKYNLTIICKHTSCSLSGGEHPWLAHWCS